MDSSLETTIFLVGVSEKVKVHRKANVSSSSINQVSLIGLPFSRVLQLIRYQWGVNAFYGIPRIYKGVKVSEDQIMIWDHFYDMLHHF